MRGVLNPMMKSEVKTVNSSENLEESFLMTAEQAWRMCNLSKSAWYKARASNRIPAPVKIGGALRWRRDELKRWIAAGCPARTAWEKMCRRE